MVLPKKEIEQSIAGGPVVDVVEDNLFGLQASTRRKWANGVVPYTLDSSIGRLLFIFIWTFFLHSALHLMNCRINSGILTFLFFF